MGSCDVPACQYLGWTRLPGCPCGLEGHTNFPDNFGSRRISFILDKSTLADSSSRIRWESTSLLLYLCNGGYELVSCTALLHVDCRHYYSAAITAWTIHWRGCRKSRAAEWRTELSGLLILTLRMTRSYSRRQPKFLRGHEDRFDSIRQPNRIESMYSINRTVSVNSYIMRTNMMNHIFLMIISYSFQRCPHDVPPHIITKNFVVLEELLAGMRAKTARCLGSSN